MIPFRYQLLYLVFFAMTYARADIVSGKCPEVSGTKFNCSEVLQTFLDGYDPMNDKTIILLSYGNSSFSPKVKSYSSFEFDFKNDKIRDYYASLNCNHDYKVNLLQILCADPRFAGNEV